MLNGPLAIDITTLDPSCGSAGYSASVFSIGTMSQGDTGSITVTAHVGTPASGQTTIDNAASIFSSASDDDQSNNTSIVSRGLVIVTPPSGGSSG
ncbi:MAG: hypothetical protein H6766_03135 [Candidatus Peribacteria bacterium]|nr:MAG: hypothetical protein H6766_06970 [Candidatus Peribacteria bacterium]USN57428.1 MAG: hypothetical protein H6766_03135 [Candidatus Peribacteria bacterium]